MNLLFFGNWISQNVADAIYWTLVHSLWQGLIAAALAGIVIVSTGRSPARIRYNLLSSILVLFVLGSIITFLNQWEDIPVPEPAVEAYVVPGVDTDLFVQPVHAQSADAKTDMADSLVGFLEKYSGMIVFTWAIFFLIKMIRMTTGLVYIGRLRRHRVHDAAEEWETKFSELVAVLGIRGQAAAQLVHGVLNQTYTLAARRPVSAAAVVLVADKAAEVVRGNRRGPAQRVHVAHVETLFYPHVVLARKLRGVRVRVHGVTVPDVV